MHRRQKTKITCFNPAIIRSAFFTMENMFIPFKSITEFQSRNNPVCLFHIIVEATGIEVTTRFNPAIIRSAFFTVSTVQILELLTGRFNPAIIRSAFFTIFKNAGDPMANVMFQSRNNPVCLFHCFFGDTSIPEIPRFNPAIIRSAFFTDWDERQLLRARECFNPAIIRSAFFTSSHFTTF